MKNYILNHLLPYTLCAVLAILFSFLIFSFSGCASGKKSLVTAQVADTVKLADKLSGIEQSFNGRVSGVEKMVSDFTAKADAQLAGIAGVNNKISKTVSDLRTGNIGGSFNDTGLMKDYIEKLAIAIIILIGAGFVLMLAGIIEHIVIIIYLLQSDRMNDARKYREIIAGRRKDDRKEP